MDNDSRWRGRWPDFEPRAIFMDLSVTRLLNSSAFGLESRPQDANCSVNSSRRRSLRNPRWTWPALMAAMGLAASSPWIDAQTYSGREPGANQSQNRNSNTTSAADVRISPASNNSQKTAQPAMNAAEAAMLRSRSARSILRNGLDYIKYQQYDKALTYLREAEKRSKELGTQELVSLRQGIESAQDGLRTPSIQVGYARTRKPMAGAIAIAGDRSRDALSDPSTLPASAEVPAATSTELQADLRPAAKPAEIAAEVPKLAPIQAEVMSKELPTNSELARSKSLDSAHRQYASAGNLNANLPPLKAPSSLSGEMPVAEIEVPGQPKSPELAAPDSNEPAAPASASTPTELPPLVMPPAVMDDLKSAAPAPLPGSPVAQSSTPELSESIPPLDPAVSGVDSDTQSGPRPAPQLTEMKEPTHLDESATLPELPVLQEVAATSPEPDSTKADLKAPAELPALTTDAKALPELPTANASESPELPAAKPEEPSLPALPPMDVAEKAPAVTESAQAAERAGQPVVPAPALPDLESAAEPKLAQEPTLPELPKMEAVAKPATETVETTGLEKDIRTVAANDAEVPVQEDVTSKPVRSSIGGIPVLTPLPDDDDGTGSSTSGASTATTRSEPKAELPTLPAETPAVEGGLPPLPAVGSADSETPAPATSEATEPVKEAATPQPDMEMPPLPTADSAPASDAMPPLPGEAPVAEVKQEAGDTTGDLPPLPVAGSQPEPSAVPDTPPAPMAVAEEATPERVAQSGRELPAANLGESLPPLPAEEVAGPAATRSALAETAENADRSAPGDISDRILSSLSPSSRRDIEQMARMQVERPGGSTPGLSPLGNLAPPEPADLTNRSMLPGSSSFSGAMDDPLVRLELPRAPSPAEARPIRAILLPEQFDNIKSREFEPRRKMWASAAVAHYPLYFQDPSLERYGISMEQRLGPVGRRLTYPIDDPKQSKLRNQMVTPFASIGLFATQIATWPLRMVADPPWESEYDLGYYRPGDRVPEDTVVFPKKGVGPLFKGNKY